MESFAAATMVDASTVEDDNCAETANDSHNNAVMNDDDDDATKSSSRATTPTAAAAAAASRSRPPPVTVLPICCILEPEKGLFRVTRSKGKTLAAGGFGITISTFEPAAVVTKKLRTTLTTATEGIASTATSTPVDDDDDNDDDNDNGELDFHQNGENIAMEEDAATPTPTPTSTTGTPKTSNTSNSYLFIEEVLFLHERGMIECYQYDNDDGDDTRNNDDSKIVTSTEHGDCTMNDADTHAETGGRQGRQQHLLDSYQLYNMLELVGVSLPIYLVYAYLLKQDYRVLRHFPNRRDILEAMEQEKYKHKSKTAELPSNTNNDQDRDDDTNDQQDEEGEDDDKQDKDNGEAGATENNGATIITNDNDTTDAGRRKRKINNMPSLKALRLQLRREAAKAPPPVLCNVNANNGNNSSSDNDVDDDDGTNDDVGVSIAFDVYRPNSNFCKGAPGLPDFYVAATHFSSSTRTRTQPLDQNSSSTGGSSNGGASSLSFPQIQRLLAMSAGRSLKIATVSDAGAVIMFGITDHGVPAIQQQGEQSSDTTATNLSTGVE